NEPASGSTTTTSPTMPRSSQPVSIAPPILPQPTRISFGPIASRLSDRIQHRAQDRFLRRLSAPDHQLERRIETIALADRQVHQILQFLDAGAAGTAQQDRVPKRHEVLL